MAQVFSYTKSLANLRSAGIVGLYAKITGDDAYYNLGTVRDANLSIEQVGEPDTYLRPFSSANLVQATIPSLQADITAIQSLSYLISALPVALRMDLADALYVQSTSLLSLKWRLVCDPDAGKHRFIEYMVRGMVLHSEMDGLVSGTPTAVGTPGSDDLGNFFSQTPVISKHVPGGVTKIEICANGDAAYVDIGEFKDAKWTWECLGDDRAGARSLYGTTALKFTFDANLLETSDDILNVFDTVGGNAMNLKLTMTDGTTMTLATPIVGLTMKLNVVGNIDKSRELALHAEGAISVVPSTISSVWLGLWA